MNHSPKIPLCVDLDHTLIRTNSLVEALVAGFRHNPALLFQLPGWAIKGQAVLWDKLAALHRPDAQYLPYSLPVLEFVRQESLSRPVVLVTGAHHLMAHDVANHLKCFSAVYATTSTIHLVGAKKMERLLEEYGERGFDYIGDAQSDMHVWRKCRHAYVAPDSVHLFERLRREKPESTILPSQQKAFGIRAFVKALRPKQWVKNTLVFIPVILGHRFNELEAIKRSLFAFALFCMASSAVYLLNDILDVEDDRRHPIKHSRPFANGTVGMSTGIIFCILLLMLALSLSALLSLSAAALLAAYVISTTLYSVWLKKLLVVDMILLASFYIQRVFLGSVVTGIPISFWTLLFCLFIFMGLATVKRYAELHNRTARVAEDSSRRAYRNEDASPLLSIGTSSFMGAIISLGLYVGSDEVRLIYKRPDWLWLICPLLLAWSSRLWLLSHRGKLADEDPLAFALRDPWTQLAVIIVGSLFILAL